MASSSQLKGVEASLRKKSFRKHNANNTNASAGLPFPNYGLGKSQLPTICRCYCSFNDDGGENGDDNKMDDSGVGLNGIDFLPLRSQFNKKKFQFFVKHQIDMITLFINGSFGTSSKTYRSPSCMNDKPFEEQFYYRKLKERQQQSAAALNIKFDSSGRPASNLCNGIDAENSINSCNNISSDSVEDRLILLAEEVIFLTFGVGCLSLQNLKAETLNYEVVWKKLVERNPEFPFLYAVYHYFRSKNWVPKAGIQFGGDYVLYKLGPELNHASYIVHITGLPSRPKPTWTELYSWQRVASGSRKKAVICEITPPDNFLPEASSPRSIFSFRIKEIVLERWFPFSPTRMTKPDIE